MRRLATRLAFVWLLAALVWGCRAVQPVEPQLRGQHRLLPLTDERILLEVFFLRMPLDDQTVETIWNEVDEQHLPSRRRRSLAQHGMRAGVIGSRLPLELERLLASVEKGGGAVPADADSAEAANCATVQQLHLRPGRRGEVVTSPNHDRLTVLTFQNGELRGRTYDNAQALFQVTCRPQEDGRVLVEMLPELRHGVPRQRFVGTDGIVRLEAGRDTITFDNLALQGTLTPGDMLLVGCLSDPPRSLGRDFLTDGTDRPVQKLLVLRLHSARRD
jgi:hypothetical protein